MKPSKLNFVGRMQRWMDSVPGKTFLNYAYSWGASIVILGALFKLTHMPLANLMLYIGMGTEVLVFFFSGFDRPFNIEDTEIPLQPNYDEDEENTSEEGQAATVAGGGSTIIIGSGGTGGTVTANAGIPAGENEAAAKPEENKISPRLQQAAAAAGLPGNTIAEIVQLANEDLLSRAQASLTPEMEEASKNYVEKLKLLTETLDRVEKQSARLTTDSEEMTNLNRTLTGINTVYELQLKSISQQVGSIDQINEQTRKMATQIEDLNGIYSRMIKALTVNMKNASGVADLQ